MIQKSNLACIRKLNSRLHFLFLDNKAPTFSNNINRLGSMQPTVLSNP